MTTLKTFSSCSEVEIMFVPVSDDAKDFELDYVDGQGICLTYWVDPMVNVIPLPPGDWSILSPTDSISEEQMKEVCDAFYLFKNYADGKFDFWNVQDSFASLLTHCGVTGRCLILTRKID